MTTLASWLEQATRHLSKDSAAQVRTEIQEHYESEREAAMNRGATAEHADRSAVTALGNAKVANRQYRKVLLTSAQARMLHSGNREARAICSRQWLKRTLLAMPVVTLLAASALFLDGAIAVSRALAVGAIAMALFFAAPFLPIYTPSRARIYRLLKWAALIGVFWLVWGPDALKYSWLLASCLWIPVWTEWTRFSIRRKLPVAEWPKQLYL
jgi:hypothetical protein